MPTERQRLLQATIDQHEMRLLSVPSEAQKAVRHKCFVSFHQPDETEASEFVEKFQDAFIPRVLGVSAEDDFINSDNTDYIMDQIRERYLTDSTVTIVLIGKCTWARRYVDWEVYSTLRNDKNNRRSGLIAITLPSAADYSGKQLPPRVADNVDDSKGYARWYKYPSSITGFRDMVQEAFEARSSKANLIANTRARKINNSSCP